MVDALEQSIKVGLLATAIALVLGSLAAFALQRNRFFGKQTVSLLILLPIALPGIVTAIALSNAFTTILGIELVHLVAGHRARDVLHRGGVQQRASPGCGGWAATSRRPRWTSAPRGSRRSAW